MIERDSAFDVTSIDRDLFDRGKTEVVCVGHVNDLLAQLPMNNSATEDLWELTSILGLRKNLPRLSLTVQTYYVSSVDLFWVSLRAFRGTFFLLNKAYDPRSNTKPERSNTN